MKGPAKFVWLLPLLLLTGCFPFHKKKAEQAKIQTLAPPIVAPAPEPAPPPTPEPSVAALTTSTATQTGEATALAAAPPKLEPRPRPRRRRPAVVKPPEETATPDTGVSALGQLSSGDPGDLRLQTQNSINSTERGLKNIRRNLSSQDQRIIEHIQEFLKQAKKALDAGDVDGASTLANKAKVLLAEVVQ